MRSLKWLVPRDSHENLMSRDNFVANPQLLRVGFLHRLLDHELMLFNHELRFSLSIRLVQLL